MGRSEAFARHFSAGWPAPRVDNMASNKRARRSVFSLIFIFAALVAAFPQDTPKKEFISYDAAKPVVATFADSLPAELKPASNLDAAKWSAWVQKADRE